MEFFQLLLVFAIAAGVGGLLLGIPSLIAPRRVSPVKKEPFECGKDPVALPEGRFAIKFSTIAIFFIIFDIELVFLWPWATMYRQPGWFGFLEMMVFLGHPHAGVPLHLEEAGARMGVGASSPPSWTRPSAGRASTRSSSTRS